MDDEQRMLRGKWMERSDGGDVEGKGNIPGMAGRSFGPVILRVVLSRCSAVEGDQ